MIRFYSKCLSTHCALVACTILLLLVLCLALLLSHYYSYSVVTLGQSSVHLFSATALLTTQCSKGWPRGCVEYLQQFTQPLSLYLDHPCMSTNQLPRGCGGASIQVLSS